jgi:hypothetical protein
MVELHEHRRRDEANALPRAQQFRAASMILIVGIEQRDERPGIDYERNGSGS